MSPHLRNVYRVKALERGVRITIPPAMLAALAAIAFRMWQPTSEAKALSAEDRGDRVAVLDQQVKAVEASQAKFEASTAVVHASVLRQLAEMEKNMSDIQRALGRIEGKLEGR